MLADLLQGLLGALESAVQDGVESLGEGIAALGAAESTLGPAQRAEGIGVHVLAVAGQFARAVLVLVMVDEETAAAAAATAAFGT